MRELDNIFEDICQDINKETVNVCIDDSPRKLKMVLLVDEPSKVNCVNAVVRTCLMLLCRRDVVEKLENSTNSSQLYSTNGELLGTLLYFEFPFMFRSLTDIIRFFYYSMRALQNFVPNIVIDFQSFPFGDDDNYEETLINSQRFREVLLELLKHPDLTDDLYTKIIIPVLSGNGINDVRYFIEDYLGKPFDDYSYGLLIENTVRPGCQYIVKEYHESYFYGIKIEYKNIKLFNVCSKRKQDNIITDSIFRAIRAGEFSRIIRIFGLSSKLHSGKYENVVLCVFTQPIFDFRNIKVLFAESRKKRPMKRSLEEFSIEEVRNLFFNYNKNGKKFNVEI